MMTRFKVSLRCRFLICSTRPTRSSTQPRAPSRTSTIQLNNLKSITNKIDQGQGTVGALINNKKIYQNVNAGATAFQENMEALKHNFFLRGFFKDRGYESAADLKKNEISQLPDKPLAKQFTYEAKRVFDKPDAAKLKDEKKAAEGGSVDVLIYAEGTTAAQVQQDAEAAVLVSAASFPCCSPDPAFFLPLFSPPFFSVLE